MSLSSSKNIKIKIYTILLQWNEGSSTLRAHGAFNSLPGCAIPNAKKEGS